MRHWRWGVLLASTLAVASLPAVVGALPVREPGIGPIELRRRIVASASQTYQGYAESRGGLRLPDVRGFSDEAHLFGEVRDGPRVGNTAMQQSEAPAHYRIARPREPSILLFR